MLLADSHCHFNLLEVEPKEIISRANEHHVGYFLNVSVSLKGFPSVLGIAEAYPFIWASVGLHPNEQDEEVSLDQLTSFGSHPKVVAVGETGLDYFRSTGDLEWQHDRFRMHIAAAKQLDKPLIIHTRQAKLDTLSIMKEEGAQKIGGVMHCFTEDWETAKQALDLGFFISFSGIVTFRNAPLIQEVAMQVPLDRLLIETDAPYLAPNPKRGKVNEPGYLLYTAEFLANMRGIDLDEFANVTTNNFFTLFKGAVRPHV